MLEVYANVVWSDCSGFQSTVRANELSAKILAKEIELGYDSTNYFYPGDNCELPYLDSRDVILSNGIRGFRKQHTHPEVVQLHAAARVLRDQWTR